MKKSAQPDKGLAALRREGKMIEHEIRSRDPHLAARVGDMPNLLNPTQPPAIPRPAGLPVVLNVVSLLISSALSVIVLSDNLFLTEFYQQLAIIYFILMIIFVIVPAFAGMYLISRGYALGLEIHYWLSLAALALSLTAWAALGYRFSLGDRPLLAFIVPAIALALAFASRRCMRSASFGATVRGCRALRIVATLRLWHLKGEVKS